MATDTFDSVKTFSIEVLKADGTTYKESKVNGYTMQELVDIVNGGGQMYMFHQLKDGRYAFANTWYGNVNPSNEIGRQFLLNNNAITNDKYVCGNVVICNGVQ